MDQIDWRALAAIEDELAEIALERGVALVLGTASAQNGSLYNEALVCGAVDREVRYQARFLTQRERQNFSPGNDIVYAECAGWRLGLAIGFDLRLSKHWYDLAIADVDAVICCAHLAGEEEATMRRAVLPAIARARSAEWVMPLVLANVSGDDRWIDSTIFDGRGSERSATAEGLQTAELVPCELLPGFYRDLHAQVRRSAERESGVAP